MLRINVVEHMAFGMKKALLKLIQYYHLYLVIHVIRQPHEMMGFEYHLHFLNHQMMLGL